MDAVEQSRIAREYFERGVNLAREENKLFKAMADRLEISYQRALWDILGIDNITPY